jgi:hypothetical protein
MKVVQWEPLQLELLTEEVIMVDELDSDLDLSSASEVAAFTASMVSESLESIGITSHAVGSTVYLLYEGRVIENGPRINVFDVLVDNSDPDVFIAQAEISFTLNPQDEDSYIIDSTTGWAETAEDAIRLATDSWCAVTAPPILFLIFSSLNRKAPLPVDWFSNGDPEGISGWDVCASGYGFKGNEREQRRVHQFLSSNVSLMKMLSSSILSEVKNDNFTYVKLYRGFDGEEHFAEGRVNGFINERLSDKLKQLPWPDCKDFVSVSQFLMLLPTQE